MARRLHCSPYTVVSIREPSDGPAPAYEGQTWLPGRHAEKGVRIIDRDARTAYVVTVEDRGTMPPVLTSRWDATFSGHRAGADWMGDDELAAIAVGVLRRYADWLAENPEIAAFPGFEDGEGIQYAEHAYGGGYGRPPLEKIAEGVRLAVQNETPIAKWFDGVYGISSATTKRWVKAAREAGLLPEMSGKPGRPRKTQESEDRS